MATLVELPILGLLREGPLHGYELKRRLESMVGFFGAVSYGSLYPMFHALEIRGYVAHTLEEYGRIVYRITPKGRNRFAQLMHDPGVALTQKLLFFEAFPSVERREILESHKEEWANRLAHHLDEQQQIDARRVDRYRAALLARKVERLEKDVIWLENLIDEEDAGSLPAQDLLSSRRRHPGHSVKRR